MYGRLSSAVSRIHIEVSKMIVANLCTLVFQNSHMSSFMQHSCSPSHIRGIIGNLFITNSHYRIEAESAWLADAFYLRDAREAEYALDLDRDDRLVRRSEELSVPAKDVSACLEESVWILLTACVV